MAVCDVITPAVVMWRSLPAVGHQTESWVVLRRYLEFYVLESKLTEFHGNGATPGNAPPVPPVVSFLLTLDSASFPSGPFADAQLPSKRIIGPKNYEFLVSKREEFEEYLQVPEHLSD